MRLLYLVQQDYAVRASADLLGQLTALVVADITRRATKQARDRMRLHILRHVEANQVLLAAKEFSRQRLRQFRLTHTGGAEEEERTNRAFGVFQTGARAANSTRNRADSLILTDNPLAQVIFQVDQVLTLALQHLADRYPCPVFYHP